MTDALAAGEHGEGQLLRFHVDVALDVFKPAHAVARSALQLERFRLALGLVARQTFGYGTFVAVEYLGQRDAIFHCQLGAGADGEVGGMGGVANENDVVLEPAFTQYAIELHPDSGTAQVTRVGNQTVAIEQIGKEVFAKGNRFGRFLLIQAGAIPGRLRRLDDEGRHLVVESVGMQVEPTPLGLLEGEGESGVDFFLGAQPDKAIRAHVDARIEVRLMLAACR